jgi:PAS domain S-box-containing protein
VLTRKVQLAFGSAILTLLVVGAVSYRGMVVSRESDRRVRHTHEVIENLQDLLLAMEGMESSYRGFALTGKESYLESYHDSTLSAEQYEATVRNLTLDNPAQQHRLPILERLAVQKIQFAEMVINLRRAEGLEAAAHAIEGGGGQRSMDEFQGVVRGLQDEELRLLVLRNGDVKRRIGQTKTALILGTVLGLLIAAAAGWSVQRESSRRDLAEKRLAHMERRYRGLLEAAPDAMVVVNQSGEIVLLNLQAEKQFGYRRDELVGQKVKNIIPEGCAERLIADGTRSATDALAQQIGTGIELSGRRRDGSEFPIEIMLSPLESTEGILVTAAIRDISLRKEAEKHLAQIEVGRRLTEDALRESEESYRILLDGIQNYAIFMMDPRGQVVSWNAGAERIKGYTADQIIGHPFSCFFTPEDIERGRPAEILRMTAASGQHEEQGMRVRKDGSRFVASVTSTALRDSAGNLRGFSEFSHDLSESKESGAKYRALLEAAPDAMVVVNQSGEIVLLNVQAEKQFGYSRDELVGQQVKNIIPEGFAERLIADGTRSAAQALAQHIGTGIALAGRRRDGSEFPIEIMLSPLESTEGILVTAAIRDITERNKSEEHLVKTVGELKRSNDELQQFAYVASHDLQEPLRMVASYTQLLAKRYKGRLDSDADEFIAFAVDGCNRMQGLIQDLLAYSRAGTNGRALCQVSGEDALQGALTNLRTTIEQSGAIVSHDSLPAIRTDETQLTQVFQNLVGNAIKYRSAEVPRVHVSATKTGDNEWIFSVRDNGLGIAPQYFERIFILFQRLHGRNEFEGTGIGLAICKKVLERLGGRIWVESQPEKGSTFRFALPERGAN